MKLASVDVKIVVSNEYNDLQEELDLGRFILSDDDNIGYDEIMKTAITIKKHLEDTSNRSLLVLINEVIRNTKSPKDSTEANIRKLFDK